MNQKWLLVVGVLGAIAVALGAFGAHMLKGLVEPNMLEVFDTGIRYHFWHVLAMGVLCLMRPNKWQRIGCIAFLFGIICFSGSLYTMTLLKAMGTQPWGWLGPITPIGGLSFILGWIALAVSGTQSAKQIRENKVT